MRKQSKQKTFVWHGGAAAGHVKPQTSDGKRFLVLFFKKELLADGTKVPA